MFKPNLDKFGRVAVTLILVAIALFTLRKIWIYYQVDPWTPDGRVRADIVQIAPDVSGIVTNLSVTNDQQVKRGQVLFQIDQERYTLALREAEAALVAQRSKFNQAKREARRDQTLGDLVAKENQEQGISRVEEAEAALSQAVINRDLAALNLQRTRVVAPTDGTLSDLSLRVGNYVSVGKPVMALIDANSFRVEGYFEETKLQHIAVGQAARVKLMGNPKLLQGHVQSIAAGIEDRDRASGSNLLPNVNPTFSWVRLAQRVPVRIALDNPHEAALIAGLTATVTILQSSSGEGKQP
ncbi:HlyD family secretion protein [Sideroxydans sp. CL21]|uniref:efflux RND transporter periplasmic adaptor subunit n=1 Tax=Sideroxydans sp. CL21 TaxID=2600596 RepID=UPI0024BCD4FC|nr:HlyD family secretion protein [Sideroxydans sp. CL21]